MTLEKKREFTLKITQANKTQMITIIYEMVMEYLQEAIDDIAIGKKDDASEALHRADVCIDELLHSVNLSFELGRNLRQIYVFSKKEIAVAGATFSMHRIWRILKNFRMLHSAYLELEKQDNSGSLMANTQRVYAGLTYGRYSLNEDVSDTVLNRGLMA